MTPAMTQPRPASAITFQTTEDFARRMDAEDPLASYRERFHIPLKKTATGMTGHEPVIYFCGNSLGLQPKGVEGLIRQELTDWATLAVDAHFAGKTPWYSYHEIFREPGARLVGAIPGEVVMMNSLTVNLHLMMATFYQPTKERNRVLIEEPAFPSDTYAVKTHLRARGVNPDEALLTIGPRPGEHFIRMDDIEALLQREGASIGLILLGGVNFLSGQVLDMERITRAGQRHGCMVGFDLAHAAGNVTLRLHDWNIDFACWCSYKYLNSGPGAVAGCFVHERHGRNLDLPRFAGWWGNDPATRFKMHLIPDFVPRPGADGWQVSNPPILALAPVKASLDLFDQASGGAGMDALRRKSLLLTGYLRFLLETISTSWWEIITPSASNEHGCQLSILVKDHPRQRFKALEHAGIVCDFREPNVIRVAPVPLYNTFMDVYTFAQVLARQP
jgi:kynureninase